MQAPLAPSNQVATAQSSSQINLTWTDNSTNETGFRIERAGSAGGPWGQVASIGANVTSFSNSGLSGSTTYYYRTYAYNAGGNSNYSNTTSATTPAAGDTTPPAVPTGLTATAVSSSQINLSWNPSTDSGGSGLAGYRVYKSGSLIASTAATTYSSTGLGANIQYCYTVAAYDNAGNVSGQSTQACATTQPASAASGAHLWSKRFGGPGSTDNAVANGIAVSTNGNTVVVGYFSGAVDFGGGALSSAGGQDIFVAEYSSAGTHLWSKRFGSSGEDYANAVWIDSGSNIIVTGSFNGALDFGGGVLTAATASYSDIFVVKYSASGAHLWSNRFGGSGNDAGYGVTADIYGDIIVTGSFVGTVDFGGVMLTSNLSSNDIFVAKYSSSTGTHLWSKGFGSTGDDQGKATAVDSSGNVVVTGHFNNSIDFGGGSLISAGLKDIFLLKLDSAGRYGWSKRVGGTSIDSSTALAVDVSGNIVITGFFYGTVDFGGGALTKPCAAKVFLARYTSAGNHIWSQVFGGSVTYDNAIATSMAIDDNSNIVITGYFQGGANFGGESLTSVASYDVFAAKYSSTGASLWSQRFGGASVDQGKGVATDSSNNVLLTGYFNYDVSFGGPVLTSTGGSDLYLVKLTP
jgi:hypothetical protein